MFYMYPRTWLVLVELIFNALICGQIAGFSFVHTKIYFQMVENDPHIALAVEAMDELAYGSYLAGRNAAVASLSLSSESYHGKKMILEQAIKSEKDAADLLRTIVRIPAAAGAANDGFTVERRDALIVRLRQNLISTRQLFLSVNSKC